MSIAKYAKDVVNKTIVLINATYQDNNDEINEYARYFDLIYVRETLSKNELKNVGIRAQVVPDMTFYSKFDQPRKTALSQIGVSDSVYMDLSEQLFEWCMEKDCRYLPALTMPVIKVRSVKDVVKYLKYSAFRSIAPLLRLSRYKFCYKTSRMLFYLKSYKDYIYEISGLKFLIAARYHSLCFALKTITPFVALKSNSHKIEGMLDDIGIGQDRVITYNDLRKLTLSEFDASEVEKILEYTGSAPLKIESMFKDIRKLLD